MPDGNALAGLYPQPPQPNANALNPMQLIGAMSAMNQNQLFQREFAAQQARGNALSGSVRPDGTFDASAYGKAVKSNPDAAFGMDPASLLSQQGQTYENSTRALALGSAQNDQVRALVAGTRTKDDLRNLAPTLTRIGVPADIVANAVAGAPDDPKAYSGWKGMIGNIAMGPAAAATRVAAPPGSAGQAQMQPLGEANVAGTQPVGLPPGQGEALATNQAAFQQDQERSATNLGNLRQLQTALPLIQQLTSSSFGPGSPEFAKIRGALTTAGLINPNTSDLQVRQEAGKYLLKYAQGAQTAGRSDAALSTAINSNPNLDLTQPANLALIKNQVAMDRMDAAIPLAFDRSHPNPSQKANYNSYKANFYQSQDQRAYSFDLMSPDERRSVIDSLGKPGSAAYQKFARSYSLAKQTGIITPQAPNGGQ